MTVCSPLVLSPGWVSLSDPCNIYAATCLLGPAGQSTLTSAQARLDAALDDLVVCLLSADGIGPEFTR